MKPYLRISTVKNKKYVSVATHPTETTLITLKSFGKLTNKNYNSAVEYLLNELKTYYQNSYSSAATEKRTIKQITLEEKLLGKNTEVIMADPRLSFRCGNKQISIKRASGGLVTIQLMGFDKYKTNYVEFAYIQTQKQFEALWEFFGGDKELPPKGKSKVPYTFDKSGVDI